MCVYVYLYGYRYRYIHRQICICLTHYWLGRSLRPVGAAQGVWGDAAAGGVARYGRFLVAEEKVRAAQLAMRAQVVSDIAVSTVTTEGGYGVSTSPASLAASGSDAMVSLNGLRCSALFTRYRHYQ